MEVGEGSDQKSDIQPHWMAADARLKNEFTEDEKCRNLMSWLIYVNEKLNFAFSMTAHWRFYFSLQLAHCVQNG